MPDRKGWDNKEYASITVPMLLDLPPFIRETGPDLTRAALELLRKAKEK